MENVVVLWDEAVPGKEGVFSVDNLAPAYEYFTRISDFHLVMGNISQVSGTELHEGYRFNGEWSRVEDISIDLAYDKFEWSDETVDLKRELNSSTHVINPLEVERICNDKLATYRKFPDYVPETQKASEDSVKEIIEKYGKAVIKPRFDYGGTGVRVIDSVSDVDLPEDTDLLVQRFMDTSSGLSDISEGVHDLRLIIMNGDLVTATVRSPQDGGYISNVSQGGREEKVNRSAIPDGALELAENVDSEIEEYGDRFYTVDLCRGSKGLSILEMNSKPGLSFEGSERMKRLQQPVIRKLSQLFSAVLDG